MALGRGSGLTDGDTGHVFHRRHGNDEAPPGGFDNDLEGLTDFTSGPTGREACGEVVNNAVTMVTVTNHHG